MTLIDQQDRIFQDWKTRRPDVIPDGVVDERAYSYSSPRLLFLLKEVNSTETGWSLIDFIRNGAQSATWDNIARWIIGIRNLNRDIPWQELSVISQDQRIKELNSVAVMNLKKSPGRATASNKALYAFASENSSLLIQQFSLYNDHPDVQFTICCGSQVGALFDRFISPNKNDWKQTFHGVPFRQYGLRKCAILYAHPEARVADYFLYYPLVRAVREILTNQGDFNV